MRAYRSEAYRGQLGRMCYHVAGHVARVAVHYYVGDAAFSTERAIRFELSADAVAWRAATAAEVTATTRSHGIGGSVRRLESVLTVSTGAHTEVCIELHPPKDQPRELQAHSIGPP